MNQFETTVPKTGRSVPLVSLEIVFLQFIYRLNSCYAAALFDGFSGVFFCFVLFSVVLVLCQ